MAALREGGEELVGLAENRIEGEALEELPNRTVLLAVVVVEALEDQALVAHRLVAAVDAARIGHDIHLAGLGDVHEDDLLGGRQVLLQLGEARKDELVEVAGEEEISAGGQHQRGLGSAGKLLYLGIQTNLHRMSVVVRLKFAQLLTGI